MRHGFSTPNQPVGLLGPWQLNPGTAPFASGANAAARSGHLPCCRHGMGGEQLGDPLLVGQDWRSPVFLGGWPSLAAQAPHTV